ncbi:preQ(1) synthase, partial [Mesorhizobium sp. M2C.T.Ca.TU.009.01.2.1]
MTDAKNLTQLGKHVETPQSPEQAVLETVPFQRGDGPPAIVRFTCPEFTSLCPVTGQPDFAHIVIDYAPDKTLVESKSLKLFMTSFRNHGAFHEECTVMIGRRVVEA